MFSAPISVFLSVCLSVLHTRTDASCQTVTAHRWGDFENRVILEGAIDTTSNIVTASECVQVCLDNVRCVSIFYRTSQRSCQLHDVLFKSPLDGVEEIGTMYFSLTEDSCPETYLHNRYLGLCYQLHIERSLYIDGLADCQLRGEHFLVIDSQEKQDHINKQTSSSSDASEFAWFLDGNDEEMEGHWVHHDGRPLTYFYWDTGYPKYETASKKFIKNSVIGKWRETTLTETKFYYCQRDL